MKAKTKTHFLEEGDFKCKITASDLGGLALVVIEPEDLTCDSVTDRTWNWMTGIRDKFADHPTLVLVGVTCYLHWTYRGEKKCISLVVMPASLKKVIENLNNEPPTRR